MTAWLLNIWLTINFIYVVLICVCCFLLYVGRGHHYVAILVIWISVILSCFILHSLWNKSTKYSQCLIPGDLTSTRAICVDKSQRQNSLITGYAPRIFGRRCRCFTTAHSSYLLMTSLLMSYRELIIYQNNVEKTKQLR